ncbi:unnamed protein product [Periconia digitata]|uniref:Uncharacterized protein n=1 Tax=Periconia digitata TaxID=1303443 RepID=A0A9W4XFQ1_9PLEO|nr:unnamed protein product [Periconia digitata]
MRSIHDDIMHMTQLVYLRLYTQHWRAYQCCNSKTNHLIFGVFVSSRIVCREKTLVDLNSYCLCNVPRYIYTLTYAHVYGALHTYVLSTNIQYLHICTSIGCKRCPLNFKGTSVGLSTAVDLCIHPHAYQFYICRYRHPDCLFPLLLRHPAAPCLRKTSFHPPVSIQSMIAYLGLLHPPTTKQAHQWLLIVPRCPRVADTSSPIRPLLQLITCAVIKGHIRIVALEA